MNTSKYMNTARFVVCITTIIAMVSSLAVNVSTAFAQNPISNDNFADALLIDHVPFSNLRDTTAATTEVNDPILPCGSEDQGAGSVWYRYVAPADGLLTLDTTGSNYFVVSAVWTDNSGALGDNIACVNNYASGGVQTRVHVTSGTTYYIEVTGDPVSPRASGNLVFNADFKPVIEFTTCSKVTGISSTECNALVALYDSTNGANWNNKLGGWKAINTPCDWQGVTCSGGHVTQIALWQDNLAGPLPIELNDLTYLQQLSLEFNQLTGIPAELSGLINNLDGLDLYSNQLTGGIPPALDDLVNLTFLSLGANQLSGSIPLWLSDGDHVNLAVLDLGDNQLTGSIPTQLGNLTNLQNLSLSFNQLTGSIPPELGNLVNLTQLSLWGNQLSGSIPPELGNLGSLTKLQLNRNQLSGSIPPELGNLTNLQNLHLNFNQLTGPIPSALGNLTSLTQLRLRNNLLSGSLPNMDNLKNLQQLWLGNTLLSGEIPDSFTEENLPTLTDLTLSCGLTSTDPNVIAFIDSILGPGWDVQCSPPVNDNFADALSINIDSIPYRDWEDTTLATTEVGDPTLYCGSGDQGAGSVWYRYDATTDGLLTLDTTGSDYTDVTAVWTEASGALGDNIACINSGYSEIPTRIMVEAGKTYYVEVVGDNDTVRNSGVLILVADFKPTIAFTSCFAITGIPQAECEVLVALYDNTDGNNWLDKSGGWKAINTPCDWQGVACSGGHVTDLTLIQNNLAGPLPTQLGNLTNLQRLDLELNQLTGGIPAELGILVNLTTLNLWSNQLTSGIPPELGNLVNLTWLALDSNQLSGNIPPELGNLVNLKGLELEDNQLTGSIPIQLGNLVNLTWLNLAYNPLISSGPIPPWLSNLTSLRYLNLNSNQLTGGIPSELGDLVNLTFLDLSNNQLTGPIPTQLDNLTSLTRLRLRNNQLSGNLPANIGNLTQLTLLRTDNNLLSGEIPFSITNLTGLTNLTLSCGLNSTDPIVIAFLDEKSPGWQDSRCIPSNQPPVITSITAPVTPIQLGQSINATVKFSDPDVGDTHTVTWDWGDGSTTTASATASHTYSSAGVYTIKVTITDAAGASDTETFQYVVIYDPNGGFVTGGGWINSPAGAYTADPTLTGKATFGFVSKYQKGANVPTGNTEFQFKVADLNFKSTSYDWLVIAGSKAQYKGTGTINGTGEYKFMLTAIDGTPDKFRIKIWATSGTIYDNMQGLADSADPTTVLGGGSIVIHKEK
jgi:Leucine-rich repeat (LRR) protein